MTIRAKMKLQAIETNEFGTYKNRAGEQFVAGEYYYFDFTPVPKTEAK